MASEWEEPAWNSDSTSQEFEQKILSIPFEKLPQYINHQLYYVLYTSRRRLANKKVVSYNEFCKCVSTYLKEVGYYG